MLIIINILLIIYFQKRLSKYSVIYDAIYTYKYTQAHYIYYIYIYIYIYYIYIYICYHNQPALPECPNKL